MKYKTFCPKAPSRAFNYSLLYWYVCKARHHFMDLEPGSKYLSFYWCNRGNFNESHLLLSLCCCHFHIISMRQIKIAFLQNFMSQTHLPSFNMYHFYLTFTVIIRLLFTILHRLKKSGESKNKSLAEWNKTRKSS